MTEKQIKYLNANEAALLVDSIHDLRHKVLILLMLDAGLRVSETINLKFGDFDFNRKVLNVRSLKKRSVSKNFAIRQIPLSSRLFLCLAEYSKSFKTLSINTLLFSNPVNPDKPITRQAVHIFLKRLNIKKLNIPHCHPHALRHSFATGLVATGTNINEVADLLGHQSVDTSRIYARIPIDHLQKSITAAARRHGDRRRWFSFLFAKPPPPVYIPSQKNTPVVGRNSELAQVSAHLEAGTNVIVFGSHGVGKRLFLDSLQTSKTVLTFDDTGGIKKSLIYLLLYLNQNNKEKVATALFQDFDLQKKEQRLSRQSISFLCDEIKKEVLEPKSMILKIKQFDDVNRQSLKVIEFLKEYFVFIIAASEIAITKAPFFWNFEKVELKNLSRLHTFELIHKLSNNMQIEDYELFRNHIWLQSDGNPRVISEMIERYRREPVLVADNIRAINFAGAIKEWDCSYFLVILIASLAVMRYMTSELENPAFRFIGGMAMIFLLMTRAFVARTKRKYI